MKPSALNLFFRDKRTQPIGPFRKSIVVPDKKRIAYPFRARRGEASINKHLLISLVALLATGILALAAYLIWHYNQL